jgi:glycosyltransferase involved in cell wall biosynthesis
LDIVYLAHFSGSPQHGMVYGHYYMAREWVRAGHHVTIVASGYAHTRFRQPRVGAGITEEYIDGIRYLWVPTPPYSPANWLGRIRNILTFVAKTWWGRLPIARADLVICSSHHPFAIHPALRLARRHGARLVFEVRDLWPLTLIELGRSTARHPFIRAMQWSEDYAYRHADKVVSVLEGSRDYMIGRGMAPDKFLFVPNGADVADSDREPLPPAHIEALTRGRERSGFLVGYAGRVGAANALHTLLDALARCDTTDIAVAILGEGSHLPALEAQAARLGIAGRVIFLEAVPKRQVSDFLARMDAVYLGLQKQPLFRHGVSPTKLNDYMLAAKPIICAIEAPGDILAESGAGFSCRAEDVGDVHNALQAMYALGPDQRAEMGARGQRWVLANRDYRMLAERFLSGVLAARAEG